MNDKLNKKYSVILFILLTICVLSFEVLFCNSIFVRSLFKRDLSFSPYVFSLPRLVFYIICYVICYKAKNRLINNRINREVKTNKIINIVFITLYAIFGFIAFLLFYKHLITIMTIGVLIILLSYIVFLHLFIGKSYRFNIFLICLITLIYSFASQNIHVLDEVTHFPAAYNIAHLNFFDKHVYYDESVEKIRILSNYSMNQDLFIHYKPNKIDITGSDLFHTDKASMLLHIPAAIGILYSEFLGGTIMDTYYFAHIFSTITFLVLACILLKNINYKKNAIISLLTIPILLLLAGTCNPDGLGYISIALFLSYIMNLYYDKKVKILDKSHIIRIIILLLMIAAYKGGSYLFTALALLLLRKKIDKKDKRIIIISLLFILAFVICYVYFSFNISSGDTRGGNVSTIGQLKFVFSNPLNIIIIPILQVFNTLLNPSYYNQMAFSYFFGKYSFIYVLPYIIFVLFNVSRDEVSTNKERLLYIISFILMFAFTSAALYLQFTEVGQLTVAGYQGRYFIELLPMLLLCIPNKIVNIKSSKYTDYYVVLFLVGINILQFLATLFVVY